MLSYFHAPEEVIPALQGLLQPLESRFEQVS